jgi:transposase InsO family protein
VVRAGCWKKKDSPQALVRHAEQPGQALNVDLCFVPWAHGDEARLPAVSGSSGHLVVEHRPTQRETRLWPGQLFQDSDLPYESAMQAYAKRTRDRLVRGKIGLVPPEEAPSVWRKEWNARAKRHRVLQKRRKQDAAWQVERTEHHLIVDAYRALTRRGRAQQADLWQAQKAHWAQREQARRELLARRKAENQRWHQANRQRRHKDELIWIAILVLTDNATRQCLGLPLFASGAHVTAQEVTDALRSLLPKELAFLISDQGTHFRSKALAQLAKEAEFVQIPIYRHRPQTNGIAERFVRTLKQELRPQHWNGPEELYAVLADFLPTYNDRPHQGLAIPGLSPNELANRLWLM